MRLLPCPPQQRKFDMSQVLKLFVLTDAGAHLAQKLNSSLDCKVIGLASRVTSADIAVASIGDAIRFCVFLTGEPIIAVMASGALIRILAPLLEDKMAEPPVLALSEDGKSVVPLLGGHHGAKRSCAKDCGNS